MPPHNTFEGREERGGRAPARTRRSRRSSIRATPRRSAPTARCRSELNTEVKVNASVLPELSAVREELRDTKEKLAQVESIAEEVTSLRQQLVLNIPPTALDDMKVKLDKVHGELDEARVRLQQMGEVQRRNTVLEGRLAEMQTKLQQLEAISVLHDLLKLKWTAQEETLASYSAQIEELRTAKKDLEELLEKVSQRSDN